MNTLRELERIIAARRSADTDESHTAKLLSGGRQGCARKFGEEALEAVIAGASGNRSELTHEAADVLYHLMVLLAANGITLDEVLDELDRRRGMSGIEEKRQRSDGSG